MHDRDGDFRYDKTDQNQHRIFTYNDEIIWTLVRELRIYIVHPDAVDRMVLKYLK